MKVYNNNIHGALAEHYWHFGNNAAASSSLWVWVWVWTALASAYIRARAEQHLTRESTE